MQTFKLEEYQTFESVEEMDKAITEYKKVVGYELNKTDRAVLEFLQRHSCKVPGVSYLLMETIANGVGKSIRTIRRVMKKLQDLFIIEKVQTIRKKRGGYGANVFRFLSKNVLSKMTYRQDEEKPCHTSVQEDFSQKETIITKSYIKRYTNHFMPNHALKRKIVKYVPRFLQHFQSHFGENILDIYRRIRLAAKNYLIGNKEMINEVSIYVFNNMLNYTRNKSLDEILALSYTIALERFKKLEHEEYMRCLSELSEEEYIPPTERIVNV